MRPWATRLRAAVPPAFGALSLIAFLATVEMLLRVGVLNRFIVPFPSEAILSISRLFIDEHLAVRCIQTASKIVVAVVIIAVVGIPIGTALHTWVIARRAYYSWFAGLASAPLVILYPLFLVLLGRGTGAIVLMAGIAGLTPVVLKTIEGLQSTPVGLVKLGKTMQLSNFGLFSKILLPAALPAIFSGLRIGLIYCTTNIIALEFLIDFDGVGQLINLLSYRYDLPGTYAAIAFAILVCATILLATDGAERWVKRTL